MSVGLLLTVGDNPTHLDNLDSLVRAAGHIVESASSINYAVHLFLAGDFDLIVLCHSLSLEQRARLTAAIRASGSYVSILPLAPPSQEGTASNLKRLLRDIEAALKRSVKPYDPRTADDLGRRPMAYGQDVVLYVAADPERVSLRRRESSRLSSFSRWASPMPSFSKKRI